MQLGLDTAILCSIYVPMMIQGYPIAAKLPEDLHAGDRFWYWRGDSGRNYIHSIYPADACPPLPGAVFVAVRHDGGTRQAMAVGRFPNSWDGAMTSAIAVLEADEIHVHLLARNHAAAEAVYDDLMQAMPGVPDCHRAFHAVAQPALCAA